MTDKISIPIYLYHELQADALMLAVLERNGLHSWEGYEEARKEWYTELSSDQALAPRPHEGV